jgi:hypothetical protein
MPRSSVHLTMRLTGELPPNIVIEVSEVAPAFGRPDGGLQVRILDANGQAFTVSEEPRDHRADW